MASKTRLSRLRSLVVFVMSLLVGASLALTACNDNATIAVGPAPIRAVTIMTGTQVVPPVTVNSTSSAEATLTGSSLVVSGRFDNLAATRLYLRPR